MFTACSLAQHRPIALRPSLATPEHASDGQRLQLWATLSDGDEALRDQRAASDVQTLQRVALGGDLASPASVTCGTSPASSDGSSLRFCRLGAAAVTGSSAADANTRFRDRTPE